MRDKKELFEHLSVLEEFARQIDYLFVSTKIYIYDNRIEILIVTHIGDEQDIAKFEVTPEEYRDEVDDRLKKFFAYMDEEFIAKAEEYVLNIVNKKHAVIKESRKFTNKNRYGVEYVIKYDGKEEIIRVYYKAVYESATYGLVEIKTIYNITVME